MKKCLLVIMAICSIATANAQKGTWLLFGNLGYMSNTDEAKAKHINWSANPGIGYQFNDNWTVGLNIYWGQVSNSDSADNSKMTTVNNGRLGPFIRYTKNIGNSVFYYYGHLDLLYTEGYSTDADQKAFDKHNGLMVSAYPAIGMHLKNGWSMNLSFGGVSYMSDKQTTDASANTIPSPNTTSTINVTFGNQVNIGMSKTFGGHKMHKGKKEKEESKKDADDDE